MLDWLVKNHEAFRDIATPFVTTVVGIVALFVQVHFNRRQSVVAEDKLKFDLFEKRFGIYRAAGELIRYVNSSKETPGEENKFYELFSDLEQSHFVFDDDVSNFIGEILVAARRLVDLLNAPADTVEARTYIKDTRLLLNRLYTEIPIRIGSALRYSQLTR